ncbi:MAG: nuclear transport factor 2 family protein [Trueperaceae bacterium]|nr:nuclear transport factor 2 family protein [Trueperaceae bacterium]
MPTTPPIPGTDDAQVLAAEDVYVAAEVARDAAALRRVVDDAFTYNASDGTTSGKDALIQSVLQMNMLGQSIRERSVRVEGPFALVFATAGIRFGRADGSESLSSLRYTAAYVKRDEGRRMLALQMQPRAKG